MTTTEAKPEQLGKKELAALQLMHPYGLTGRTLVNVAKLSREQIADLVKGGYIERDRPGCYDLTTTGRQAIGILL